MQFSRSVLIMAFLAAISSSIQHLVVADNNIDINNVIDQVTRAHGSFQKIPHLTLDFSIHYSAFAVYAAALTSNLSICGSFIRLDFRS